MWYSYFRVQQELAKMILSSLEARPSEEQAREIYEVLANLMIHAVSPSMDDLYEAGVRFRVWIVDTDLRIKDAEYDKLLSDEVRKWAETNLHDPCRTN